MTTYTLANLKQGEIRGLLLDKDVRAFLGLPFARAPLGALRWQSAQAPLPWPGVRRDCTAFAPSLMQTTLPLGSFYQKEFYPATRPMSEDGLYCNVYSTVEGEKKPVYVWIHGGGFAEGSCSALQFDGQKLAQRGLVVVTLTYRMGAFGFLAHPELTREQGFSGNWAVSDLVQALRFIRENAEAFGGDPDNVTIDGQSAGSMAVCALLCCDEARGLFRQAITQSGPPFGRVTVSAEDSRANAEADGVKLMELLHCKNINEMRLVPPDLLRQTALESGLSMRPIIDGHYLKKNPGDIFEAGEQAPVTLIAGFNDGEKCGEGMKHMAQCQRAIGQRAYHYCFRHRIPDENGETILPFHSAELVYQFGTLDTGWRPWKDEDYALSERIMDGLADFCRTGALPFGEDFFIG